MSNTFSLSRSTALHTADTGAIRLPGVLPHVLPRLLGCLLGGLLGRIETILAVWRQRRCLAEMDASRLEDIGVTAREAAREAARPVWDVPVFWRN